MRADTGDAVGPGRWSGTISAGAEGGADGSAGGGSGKIRDDGAQIAGFYGGGKSAGGSGDDVPTLDVSARGAVVVELTSFIELVQQRVQARRLEDVK